MTSIDSLPDSLPTNRRTGAFERRVGMAWRAAAGAHGGRIVVATSGGPDSTAVLVAISRVISEPSRIVAAHFDHGLRPFKERRAERAVVERVAGCLGINVVTGRRRGGSGERSELALRDARYRWLARACGTAGATLCLTGHTRDDQAETVLMRLVRGAGSLGAAAMQPVAPWPVASPGAMNLSVVRPLLGLSRVEVERYLDVRGIEAAHDPSNDALDYTRNRIRHEVMPALSAINPKARQHLAAFAESSRGDEAALAVIAEGWVVERQADGRIASDRVSYELPRQAMRALPEAIALRVVRHVTRDMGLVLESTHLVAVRGILGRAGARVDLPGGQASTTREMLRLQRTVA
ncbi:MAG: tRNA lysidine(34) synthetase TilS [Chloroflexi bacterium]|nr:tRNA lysidine(34) synthetase TilS [Chloroflexota bacterium]